MNDMNGVGPVVDLGEVQRRQQEKAKVPAYAVGSPEFALPVGTSTLSFREALDRAATILDADGFTVEEVKHCAFAGQDQNGSVIFQVVVRVSETEKAY
jgi:hypothetical protein